MMLRAALLALLVLCPQMLRAGVAEDAAKAAAELQAAVASLDAAVGAKDSVAALTSTIKAYEYGLAALREALRQAALREDQLLGAFNAKRDQVAQLLGVLSQLDPEAGPMLLLHPTGPLGTARSGMLLADVTPALQKQAEALGRELNELNTLKSLQKEAGMTLNAGLRAAVEARSALSQAIADRTTLPKKFTESPEVLRGLLESADTLEAFAAGLALDAGASSGFVEAKGKLDLPVLGTILLFPNEADATGATRPGLTFAVRPGALLQSPWPATIRYRGPLLDYGNVMIIEPGGGYLLVVAGLDQVYGDVGEVIAKGAPLGLMGGTEPGLVDFAASGENGDGLQETETYYLELRQGADPVDPMEWFAATAGAGE